MRFLVVSGPTREPLDPVRYLSNYSTGTMGKFLAASVKKRGHRLNWIRCPDDAETALDLLKLLKKKLPKNDVLIMAAAVCDARPARFSDKKIKKAGLSSIRLVKNPDILAELSKKKKKNQVFIGFALESENSLRNGAQKLQQKGLQVILIQKVMKNETPFGEKRIDAVVLDACGCVLPLKKVSKAQISRILVRQAEEFFGVAR